MTIKKLLPTSTIPQTLQLIRGSGVVIAEVTCGGTAQTHGVLYLAEIEQVLNLLNNFNTIYDSL